MKNMEEKNNIYSYSDEELKKRLSYCVETYKNGLLILEDIMEKIKLNRLEISLIEEEIVRRGNRDKK